MQFAPLFRVKVAQFSKSSTDVAKYNLSQSVNFGQKVFFVNQFCVSIYDIDHYKRVETIKWLHRGSYVTISTI